MSLVQAYIYKDFILVCGEQRATLSSGEIRNNWIKVRKLNNSTIIGMTGTIEGNYFLFSDYINQDFTTKINKLSEQYAEIENRIVDKFYSKLNFLQEHSIHSLICGWDGEKMTGKSLFTKDENLDLNLVNDLTPRHSGEVKVINCGLKEHYENAQQLNNVLHPNNILQFKNLFKDVIDMGMKFDNTINNKLTFEKIRRCDLDEKYHR